MMRRTILVEAVVLSAAPLMVTELAMAAHEPASLAARTDAFVEKARRTYPSDADCKFSIAGEFLSATSAADARSPGKGSRYVRWASVPGISNLRDIGGWNGLSAGRVYRGSCNTAKGAAVFSNPLGFKTEIDLREKRETKANEVRSAPNYVHIPLKSYTNMFNRASAAAYAKVLRVFCNAANYPIYIHCVGGADRTASVIYLLDGLCGASRTDAEIDYELTTLCGAFGARSRADGTYKPFRPMMLEMMNRPGGTWNEKVANFVEAELGLAEEEVESIRRNLAANMEAAAVVRDIPYAPENGKFGLGDLYLPEKASPDTPVVLVIHGGGWTGMCRADVEGIARFFCDDLGFAAFNVDYRLASATSRWPACGDDCLAAARFVLSPRFSAISGLAPKKIWICGGSAGGHLTLWTALNLSPEKVAGALSISGIADTEPDRARAPRRYRWMVGEGMPEANPLKIVKPNGPRLLLTHAVGDKVVPVESERSFAAAYRAAGNVAEVFEYPNTIHEGLTGHCIWIPGSKPHRLIPELEARIAAFTKKGTRE